MFKNTVRNEQLRLVRAVENNRQNAHGVDETSFKDPNSEYENLFVKKRELEAKASALNARIKHAKIMYYEKQKEHVSLSQVTRWEIEKSKVSSEIIKTEALMKRFKNLRNAQKSIREENFEKIFLHTARNMLAPDVFDRIYFAASHRTSNFAEEVARACAPD